MDTKQLPPPGSIISRPKLPVAHVGLYLGNDQVFHNTPEKGEHISSWNEFAQCKNVTVKKQGDINFYQYWPKISERLALASSYSLLSNNCEHAVSRIIGGVKNSPQIQQAVLLAGIGASIAACNNKSIVNGALCGLLAFTVVGLMLNNSGS